MSRSCRFIRKGSGRCVYLGGCGPRRCRVCAICRPSAASLRSALRETYRRHRWPELRPEPSASSWPACEDGSTWSRPVPNFPQGRSCHEKGRAPKGNVITRDGTPRYVNMKNNYFRRLESSMADIFRKTKKRIPRSLGNINLEILQSPPNWSITTF